MFGFFPTVEEAYEDQNLKCLQRMHLMNFEFHVTLKVDSSCSHKPIWEIKNHAEEKKHRPVPVPKVGVVM